LIRIRNNHAHFLVKTALFYQGVGGKYRTLKKAGMELSSVMESPTSLPNRCFVRPEDKEQALGEMHRGVADSLRLHARSGDVKGIKDNLLGAVEDSLSDPRSGNLEGMGQMVNALAQECAEQPAILRNLATLSFTDYTTALHSINVMALSMGYCIFHKHPMVEVQAIGKAALLHDVGKSEIRLDILQANRRLTPAEFDLMKKHTTMGRDVLQMCGITDELTAKVALQHHEKLDGSGYPKGIRHFPFASKLVAIIDCYEALTADERPYRNAMPPLKALTIIKEEVVAGKLDREVFEKFVATLM
jgi:HD-GYP domain-containing protein (c-di-GMP phosphodiesterase class II)